MEKLLLNFIQFSKRPSDYRFKGLSAKNKTSIFFTFFITELTLTALIIFPLITVLNDYVLTLRHEPIDYSHNSFAVDIITSVLLAPIIEEIMFRLPLKHLRVFNLFISREHWNRIFKGWVYFSCICFGLIHAANYTNDSILFYSLIPIIIASQLTGGFILAYLRIRIGLSTAILYHCLWNLSLLLISVSYFYFFGSNALNENHHQYSIKITESMYHDKNAQIFSIETTAQKFYTLNIKQYALQHTLDSLFGPKYEVDDVIVDIHFQSLMHGHNEEDLVNLLRKKYTIEKIQ